MNRLPPSVRLDPWCPPGSDLPRAVLRLQDILAAHAAGALAPPASLGPSPGDGGGGGLGSSETPSGCIPQEAWAGGGIRQQHNS